MPLPNDLQLVDTPTAAQILGCKERTVRKFIAERRIPFVRVGRLVRFRLQDLAGFIDANTVEAIQ